MDRVCNHCTRTLNISLFRVRQRKCGPMPSTICKNCESGAVMKCQRMAKLIIQRDPEFDVGAQFRKWRGVVSQPKEFRALGAGL